MFTFKNHSSNVAVEWLPLLLIFGRLRVEICTLD
jgi:hypothetical protein